MIELIKFRKLSARSKIALRMAAGAALLASSVVVVPALATPGSGFSVVRETLVPFDDMDVKADKTGDWDLMVKTKDTTDLGVDKLTIQPGGYSGWHTHTGAVFVTITSGEIVEYDGERCSTTTYRAGEGFVEESNHPHNVVNASGAVATIVAVQMRPHGSPGRVDANAPTACNFR